MSANKHEYVNRPRKHIFLNNLLGGLAWGLGATIGLSIIIAVLGIIGNHIGFIPFIGDFVSNTLNSVLQNNPQLVK
ncbi:MAG: hypothetical protein A2186_00190 [Candidatus Levybacteria bacterium RIFOXYA1_FULL_41_10]|nr:MAG: hypothetical protein UT44_C0022G0010 [Candidatus Levybacteria bacterium GW2011_GWA1_39_32]KKR50119.1 MAG: hypothetical protein UT87_C0020G0007 [Candidatus Levybacteria bacterium GW2011_GWC1_40_19]KKR94967.1 MAG: hypothetical protein UU45_C0005G0025 [Candidatus Levybacteria bacterium GW2011_GWA2_41_15]OGH21108.1 MAG: hypothetical protein A2695_00050 [Candidatus Levybacteria bacterium RIFCSPHIGHO2_01_FULL_40_83]OGH27666.1 MAG: hypothetical protein A3D82_03890 [Candidatus Levybacteria bact